MQPNQSVESIPYVDRQGSKVEIEDKKEVDEKGNTEKSEAKTDVQTSEEKPRVTFDETNLNNLKNSHRKMSVIKMFADLNIINLELERMNEHPTVAKLAHVSVIRQNQSFIPLSSPLLSESVYYTVAGGQGYLPASAFIYPLSIVNKYVTEVPNQQRKQISFILGGPRKQMYFNPKKVAAAIVTCGGLCPGLNVVIREITNTLEKNYGVSKIYGIQYGYKGFYTYNWIDLSSKSTKYIHKMGGTILGSSRGGFDLKKIMKKIKQNKVNQVYIIGGDGTLKGTSEIDKYCRENELDISIVGLPKTIDNDIRIIDRSFGYQTSVEEALKAINSAETEAMAAEYGVGLVKLMGRSAGHIALEASLSHRGVNILLIPEVKFEVFGEKGLLAYVFKRLLDKHHCVIVAAEGAFDAVIDFNFDDLGKDKSGNKIMPDIGNWLKNEIVRYCKSKDMDVTLKFIDPTYMIRTLPSNAFDTQICAELATNAVHGAMAGFTGFTSALVNGKNVYIPLEVIKDGNKKVKQNSKKWQRLLGYTGQPSFLSNEDSRVKGEYEEMLK